MSCPSMKRKGLLYRGKSVFLEGVSTGITAENRFHSRTGLRDKTSVCLFYVVEKKNLTLQNLFIQCNH